MTNQRQMMEKIDVLDSKLEKLQSNNQSSPSTVMELLAKINERLNQLSKNASHACCGGPIILQTTRHANVVHQPVLDPCLSCRDIRNDRTEILPVAPSEDNISSISCPLNANYESTKTSNVNSTGNDSSKCVSGQQHCMDFVSDKQNDSYPEPQIMVTSHHTSSPRVTSSVHGAPPEDLSEPPKNNKGSVLKKVSCVSESEDISPSMSSEQTLPATKHSSKTDAYIFLSKESSSMPKGSQCKTVIVSQPPISAINNSPPSAKEVSNFSRQQRISSSQAECRNVSSPSCTQHFITASTHVPSVNRSQVRITPLSQPSFSGGEIVLSNSHAVVKNPSSHATEMQLDYKSTATVFPDTSCSVSNLSSGLSHFTPQHTILVANGSTSSTPSRNTCDKPSSGVQVLQEPSPPVQKNIPPGYIALSHTPTVPPSPSTPNNTTAWQPQTVMSTGFSYTMHQRTEFHSSPASHAILSTPGE